MNEETLTTGYTPAPGPVAPPMPALPPQVPNVSVSMPLPVPSAIPLHLANPQHMQTTPLATSEAVLYFAIGVVLNFFGLIISALVRRGMTPCLLGFAFSFAIYDAIVAVVIGYPIGISVIAAFFLIIIFYRYHSEQEHREGNMADFAFYMTLAIPFNAIGLFFGLFQSRRKGAFGAALGFFISMSLLSIAVIIVGGYAVYNRSMLIAIGIIALCLSIAQIVIVSFKIARGDANALGFLFFLLLTAMFPPIGILAAVLHPNADSKFGGIFGMFAWVCFAGIVNMALRNYAIGAILIVVGIALDVALVFMLLQRKNEPPEPTGQYSGWFNPSSAQANFSAL